MRFVLILNKRYVTAEVGTSSVGKLILEKSQLRIISLETRESKIVYDDGHYKLGLPWREENAVYSTIYVF